MSTETHPVQINRGRSSLKTGQINKLVTLRAYEVYKYLYGEQKAIIVDGCRGGFSAGELIAFLYAYSFPKTEWSKRVDEAFDGIVGL